MQNSRVYAKPALVSRVVRGTPQMPSGGTPISDHGALWACVMDQRSGAGGVDLMALPSLLHATRGGTGSFIEVLGGTHHSATRLLEACFGWRGVLVEPDTHRLQQVCLIVFQRAACALCSFDI